MFELCYKQYDFKMTLNACKSFYDDTGLDLQTVFMKYIVACQKTFEMTSMERLVLFSDVFPRAIAVKAMYYIIKEAQDGISIAELEDATFRVGWLPSDESGEKREPWPLVMLSIALKINEQFTKGLEIKKTDTSDK